MTIRVIQFTDTGEWYAGAKTTGSEFMLPLDEWAAQIGNAHNRPVEGFEFENPGDDPRTGTLVFDVPGPAEPEDPERAVLAAGHASGASRQDKDAALDVLLRRALGT